MAKKFNIRQLIENVLNETTIEQDGSKFTLRTGVNKNETKLGVKVQFEPQEGMLDKDTKSALEVALQEKLNDKLKEYDIQVSKDTDVPREDVIGFFIPLEQIKNLIVQSITGEKVSEPKVPAPGPNNNKPTMKPPVKTTGPDDAPPDDKGLDELKKVIKSLVKEQSLQGMKRNTPEEIEQEFAQTNPQEYQKIKDRYIAQGGRPGDTRWVSFFFRFAMPKGMMGGDWYGLQIHGSDGDIVVEKKSLNEMRVRDLNEASKIVIKEDFYSFINAGNNIIRTFEENGKSLNEAKKYMKYLLQHNIM